jgi:hypothetical protein
MTIDPFHMHDLAKALTTATCQVPLLIGIALWLLFKGLTGLYNSIPIEETDMYDAYKDE